MISSSRNEEMSSGTDEMEAELDAGGKAGLQDFRYALRKFRNHSENFAIPFFAELAKFRYHSESYYA